MCSRLLKVLLLAVLILVAGFAALLLAARPYMVPTGQMRPTLELRLRPGGELHRQAAVRYRSVDEVRKTRWNRTMRLVR